MKLRTPYRMVLAAVLLITGTVSSYAGNVQNHDLAPISPRTWTYEQRITSSSPVANGVFGHGVAINGTTAIVGQSVGGGSGAHQGKAYAFTFDGATWAEQQVLTASDSSSGDLFGYTIVLQGNTALISAIDRHNQQGAVYVFNFNGTAWVEQQILTASDPADGDQFGGSIDIDGNTAVIGAGAYWGSGPGAGYVFVFNGSTWSEQAKLTASDGEEADLLGLSGASISGDRVILGASHKNTSGDGSAYAPGAAYVFVRSGTTWTEQQKLLGDDGPGAEEFGSSPVLDGDLALVGEIYTGLVYAFHWNGSIWERVQKFNATGGTTPNSDDRFGWNIALEGSTAVIGAMEASYAAVFIWDGTTWSKQATLTSGVAGHFGDSVAISGSRAIVGAKIENGSGAAYLFNDINGVELLTNPGFETATVVDYAPDGWERIHPESDIRKCNKPAAPPIALEGECVYQFKGNPGENTDLKQDINLATFPVSTGDTLVFSGSINATGAVNTRVRVLVKYDSLPSDKIVVRMMTPTNGWDHIPAGKALTVSGDPTVVRLIVNNQGTSGKVYYDAMSLQWADTGSPLIALPLAP